MQINRLKNDDVLKLLNIVYSMFLAVLARFSIEQTSSNDIVTVNFLLNNRNWLVVVLMYTYFAFDWLTTNFTVHTKTEQGAHNLLPFMVVFVLVLGGLVAFSFQPTSTWIFCLGIYAAVVPFYDIISTQKQISLSIEKIGVYIIILMRCAIGMLMITASAFKLWLHPDGILDNNEQWFILLVVLYVILKIIRYFMLYLMIDEDSPVDSEN